MSIRTDVSSAHRSTITKALASLGIVAAAAAVAGLGTYGTFTDSTTPVDTDVATGVLSIELGRAASYASVPLVTGGLLPGDTMAMPFDLENAGTVDWASVTFESEATASTLLDTDAVNGLQVRLESCSVPWTVAGPGSYSCTGGATQFYSGPIITKTELANSSSLTAGQADHLLATIELPADAGNEMKTLTSNLSFTLTAAQRDGAAR